MRTRISGQKQPLILSLFCGCGGLDLGFEMAGFRTGLAFDLRAPAVRSHNFNRNHKPAYVADVAKVKLAELDKKFGDRFDPVGVIGGPPCQSFSRGNTNKRDDDPRATLVSKFFDLALKLHRHRSGLDFIVMENVLEVGRAEGGALLKRQVARLEREGFHVTLENVDSVHFGVAQSRRRLILVAVNAARTDRAWTGLTRIPKAKLVRDVIHGLEEPIQFSEFKAGARPTLHNNHWCMTPKSKKFFDGSLKASRSSGRSFKVLDWNKPSYTVSYGHREVHVHPDGHRRLSVYEAMLLQGFPKYFELLGNLSDQLSQVSEAVPPPLAKAVAESIKRTINYENFSSNAAKAVA